MAKEKELEDFTKDELLALAEQFGVEAKHSMRKDAIIAEFVADGVTMQLINGLAQPEDEDDDVVLDEDEPDVTAPVEADDDDLVLVKLVRENPTYEIRGHRFTREHPYGLVKEADADYLVEVDGGFRTATPKEAREFYG